ncbi:MAG: hypothetical protein F4W92_03790 [Gammaproteobacteria bacterium]|nr:hypothetical protein [Gammaproteobacteria bacterium]
MRTFLKRGVVVMIGLLIGLGSVGGALLLLQDDMSSVPIASNSTTQKAESVPLANVSERDEASERPLMVTVPSRIDDMTFPNRTFERKAGILFWIDTLTDDQVVNWLEQTTDRSLHVSFVNRIELQAALLQKLSTTAPDRALNFALNRDAPQRFSMIRSVYAAWARSDVNKAIESAKTLNEQDSYHALASIFDARTDLQLERLQDIAAEFGYEQYAFDRHFNNLTEHKIENPREIWYEIVNLANRAKVQNSTGAPLGRVAIAWIEENGLEILDEILSSISNEPKYFSIISQILADIPTSRPEELFDYIVNNLGDRAAEVIDISEISAKWAEQDPKGMLSKVQILPSSRFRQNLMTRAVYNWANDNPREILEQLKQLPPRLRDIASRLAIQKFTNSSPAEAAKFIMQVADDGLQSHLAQSFAHEWVKVDSKAAKAWAQNLPTTDPMRASFIGPLTRSLVQTDPQGAFELALQQPIDASDGSPNQVIGHEVWVLDRIATYDVQLALELLPQVREAGSARAYTNLGSALIRQGDSQQALNLATQLKEREKAEFYQGIAMSWARHDPKDLLENFDGFPTSTKSRIATGLVLANEVRGNFSTKEIVRLKKHINEKDMKLLNQIREIDISSPSEEDLEIINELYLW